MSLPVLFTEDLLLRSFVPDDAGDVARLCNDPALCDGTLSLPYPYPVSLARNWIASQRENRDLELAYEFAVTDRISGALYGCISLSNHAAHGNGEIGYWIGKDFWGRGIATQAGKALLHWAFAEKGFHRIYGRHFSSNPASGRVLQKLGMTYEGTQREHLLRNGTYRDVLLYGILASEEKPPETA